MVTKTAWLLREIRLTGDLDATIEYSARGLILGSGSESVDVAAVNGRKGGIVKVNGVEVAALRRPLLGAHLVQFSLRGRDRALTVTVRATVESGFLPTLGALSISVADLTVYDERFGHVIIPTTESAALPIASGPATPSDGDLPIPASSCGMAEVASLPVAASELQTES